MGNALLRALDGLFDRVYASRHNPVHRTGTLASLFLTVALVTGVYLLCVYDLSRPYASVAAIQADVFLGRWIRALHRYASDAAVVAVVLHALRMFIQRKTWGPRTLAWITGVLLTAMLLLSGVTGFVLVWDELGQRLAVAGARMLRVLPLFPEPPDRAFAGEHPLSSQFFFMNLFLHVAIPLGMIAFLWLHTSRLARAAWFPERRVVVGALAGAIALSLAWPAPLPRGADLLAVPGRAATDWFYAGWLPLVEGAPGAALVGAILAGAVLLLVPWGARPRRGDRAPAAAVDPESCEGCRQCFTDCPYDAIEMVPGLHPERHPLRALVQADACVSCGLCAGSCASLAIGPPGQTARHQLGDARALVHGRPSHATETVVVACRADGALAERLRDRADHTPGIIRFEVDCAGVLHPATVSYLASRFHEAVVVTCPPHGCVHREGAALAEARLLFDRAPAIPGRIARQAVRVLHASSADWRAVVDAIGARVAAPSAATRAGRAAVALLFSAALFAGLALVSGWPQGTPAEHAVLRLGWRLAGQVQETCRDRTADELARLPVHMRAPRACVTEALPYALTAQVDGQVVVARTVAPAGVRGDRPLIVEEDVVVPPGAHDVAVTFVPADPDRGGVRLAFQGRLRLAAGRVVLVTSAPGGLVARE